MCIPVDSMLWALVGRIRDERYVASASDFRALLGSGCTKERIREVLRIEAARSPERSASLGDALRVLEDA